MKRSGNRLDAILTLANFRLAFRKAIRGKRHQPDVLAYAADLDANLATLVQQLSSGNLEVGRFHQFVIHDPKERIITAPCLRERILHHAILNVCEPDFERFLIHDSYACRKGKGRIAALLRAREFAARFGWFAKLDIRRYFDSIPHDRLLDRLHRRFADSRLMAQFERIVRSFRGEMGLGLPIGALTSQHFANFYLGWVDHFVKHDLRLKGYVRYMDDVALWDDDRTRLRERIERCASYLDGELGLTLKPVYLNRVSHGMGFLGCRVLPRHMILNHRARVRFRRKLHRLEDDYLAGTIDESELQQRATALVAFTRTTGLSAWSFRRAVLQSLPVSGQMARTR